MAGVGVGVGISSRSGATKLVASAYEQLKTHAATLALYKTSDLTTMWQDRAGTTTQAVVGQPLGYIKNMKTSATALHMAAIASDARRPTLSANGPVFDGVDDGFSDAATSGLPTSATILMLVKTTDTDAILFSHGVTAFVGCWDATAGAISGSAGTPTVKVDGVSKATRSALQAAINDNVTHTVLIEAADLSTWTTAGFGAYNGASFPFSGTMVPLWIGNSAASGYAAALALAQTHALNEKAALGL